MILQWIEEARASGARLQTSCQIVGLDVRTIQRWQRRGGGDDLRAGPKEEPSNKLSSLERKKVLQVANSEEFRNLSPKQIVPMLADRGEYVASESTFYRILREEKQMAHRGRAKPATRRAPAEKKATGPNQVWSWDITYLKANVRGTFYYLYMFMDVWSRRIVGHAVFEEENERRSSSLLKQIMAENGELPGLVLHSDNGGPMKGATIKATMEKLGVLASYSRPAVSNDNPCSEALFRTMKYRPSYPNKPFENVEQAREWVAGSYAGTTENIVTAPSAMSLHKHVTMDAQTRFFGGERKPSRRLDSAIPNAGTADPSGAVKLPRSSSSTLRKPPFVRPTTEATHGLLETTHQAATTLTLTVTDVFVHGAASRRYHYEYDVAGNRIGWTVPASIGHAASSCTSGGVMSCAEYDVQDRLMRYGSTTFTYNDAGQMLTRTDGAAVTTYDYDVFGNLRGATLRGGTEITYAIDARGRRVGRYVDGTADRFWVYQDGLNPVAQFDGGGNLQMVFVYGLRGNVPELIVMQSGQVLRVIADQVGSVRRIVDVSDGSVWQDTRYSPFGVVESETLRAGFDQPFRFAGGIWDADTRLIRFGARDYDVLTGRWTTKDPIRFDGGVNLYEYANGAPQMYVDPDGRNPIAIGWLLVKAAGVIAAWVGVETLLEGGTAPNADRGWGPFRFTPVGNAPDWHRDRNRNQQCPPVRDQCSNDMYVEDSSGAHDDRTFRGIAPSTRGFQCSYQTDGMLSTDPVLQGSYDYFPPDQNLFRHLTDDVLPAFVYGTRPTEP